MKQPSITNYRHQLLEAKLTAAAASCPLTHCDAAAFIKHMEYLAKINLIQGCDAYANFRVKPTYTQPYQLHLAITLGQFKRGT